MQKDPSFSTNDDAHANMNANSNHSQGGGTLDVSLNNNNVIDVDTPELHIEDQNSALPPHQQNMNAYGPSDNAEVQNFEILQTSNNMMQNSELVG